MKNYMGSVALVALMTLSGCGSNEENNNLNKQTSQNETENESVRLNAFFEKTYQRDLASSPETQVRRGIRTNYARWNDRSEARALQYHQENIADLAALKKFDFEALDDQTKLSYRLFKIKLENALEGYKWRDYSYPINQMFGWHTGIATFMINSHRVKSLQDAKDYVTRLEGVKASVDQRLTQMRRYQAAGVLVPKFVFSMVLRDVDNIVTGAPFDQGADSAILADFKKKVAKLELKEAQSSELVEAAKVALLSSLKPAYADLKSLLLTQQAAATTQDGAWKLPKGGEFYNYRLRQITTTDMSADEIHDLGLREVARIHSEMRDIMKKVEFAGSLQDFFSFTRTDPQFYYPETKEGKKAYLDEATQLINIMKTRLDEVFITKPKADLEVRAVEAFREASAGKAFYNRPSADGSRPGYYYANLYKMSSMPKYQMEALAYHEGIPGHHMQLSLQVEMKGLPKFRKYGGFTAYSEGWGLYSEYLPKEMGFYSDPYSDFGRLAMELWRACRLVVDTGLHYKKWTREEAIKYLGDNTPNDHGDVVKAIERYIVMPAQATAYKIGMIKILSLRENAKKSLGDKFDIREYHEVILKEGPVPLSILEENVMAWIKSKK
jgi:uncharacterized protein (DUF885 family)